MKKMRSSSDRESAGEDIVHKGEDFVVIYAVQVKCCRRKCRQRVRLSSSNQHRPA